MKSFAAMIFVLAAHAYAFTEDNAHHCLSDQPNHCEHEK